MIEAPTNDPRAGKAAMASLAGAGAGEASGLWAMTALIEAAATKTTQAIFFISILLLYKMVCVMGKKLKN